MHHGLRAHVRRDAEPGGHGQRPHARIPGHRNVVDGHDLRADERRSAGVVPDQRALHGSGIAYNTASILGAAVAPFIATWLATSYGVGWVGIYLLIAAALTFVALLVMRETRDQSLDDVGA